ncbi:hypothetical protein Rifp1Sym_cv00030 [endosymbiont of Riftia pachyptila (vent Ph05)]|uniref:Uncharacterized protein n=2 Tax=sulfur-oxidizing symbionts TaxID=32036 RepID=G2FJ67_9GAMM|nr:hypothetical protein Rifp1Sym_cv00030 [endosymbiont of Riftia pachyptila (vent Ph05)]EGW53160.1 hypothetical protein TevJSym_bk00150 [endosymbiont of Tevnia jerichonana (vent Tica)]
MLQAKIHDFWFIDRTANLADQITISFLYFIKLLHQTIGDLLCHNIVEFANVGHRVFPAAASMFIER